MRECHNYRNDCPLIECGLVVVTHCAAPLFAVIGEIF